ncbi:MAG: hypothetical protein HFJ40_03705 [Clostridia bacterium]|nr:hypothetical protein [Clostridia bacterium]
MSSRLTKRIIKSSRLAVTNFMFIAIFYKFFPPREDWLTSSIIWSISWAVGHFTSQCISTLKNSRRSNLLIDVEIIVAEIIAIIFLIGAVIGLTLEVIAWKEILMNTVMPFGIVFTLNNTCMKND